MFIGYGQKCTSISQRSVTFSVFLVISFVHPFFSSFPWPCGVAEQCSRHRGKGAQCLSVASLRDAGGLANRAGNPKGHTTANMVLGPFAETKGPRLPGRNPATLGKQTGWAAIRGELLATSLNYTCVFSS